MKVAGILVAVALAFAAGFFVRGVAPSFWSERADRDGAAFAFGDPDMNSCRRGATQQQCDCLRAQMTQRDFRVMAQATEIMSRSDLSQDAKQAQVSSIMSQATGGDISGTLALAGAIQVAAQECHLQ
jgi:hypothetical protein